jgi:hypothetical protein
LPHDQLPLVRRLCLEPPTAHFVNNPSRLKTTLAVLLDTSMALQPIVSLAAMHQNSYLKTDSTVLQTIDMTANTDFDFDASPAVIVGTGGAR